MTDPDDTQYLREVERLAHAVVERAHAEGWLAFDAAREVGQTPLQMSINELARTLRFLHHDNDGCLDH